MAERQEAARLVLPAVGGTGYGEERWREPRMQKGGLEVTRR